MQKILSAMEHRLSAYATYFLKNMPGRQNMPPKYLAYCFLALGLCPTPGYADASGEQLLAQLSPPPTQVGGAESEVESSPMPVPVAATPAPTTPIPVAPFTPSGYVEAG